MGIESGLLGTWTIANGTSLSPGQAVGAWDWLGLKMPTAWTAAGIQLEFSEVTPMTATDADWWTLANAAGDVVIAATNNRYIVTSSLGIYLPIFKGNTFMRIRSGTRASPVNQAAARDILVYGRRLA